MPQWAGSCWYYLRYLDPENDQEFVDPKIEDYWLGKDPARPGDPGGVDLYVGGVEHAVLHLLYARFWHKVLYDLGHVSSEEPFRRLFNQGYIQAFAYTDARGTYVPAEEVVEAADGTGFTWNGQPVRREYGKMGKSLRNVVTPDEMCERYGADTFRLYEMSTGPMEVSRPWSTRDVVGSQRFLQRVWRNLVDEQTGQARVTDAEPDVETLRALHKAIAGVHGDFLALHYNTAAAKLIELNNHLTKAYGSTGVPRSVAEPLVQMMAPLTPHIAEELWARLGHARVAGPRPVPGGRRALPGGGDRRVPDPGQRQGAVPGHGARGRRRRAGRGGRAGRREDRRRTGRAVPAQADRGPRPPGQRGRRRPRPGPLVGHLA